MKRISFFAGILICLLAATALAQPPDNRPNPASQGGAGNPKRERLRERIEMMTMWRLTQTLDLDQATAQKLFPVLNQHEIKNRQLRAKRADLLKQLNEELGKEAADPAILRKSVEEYKKTEIEIVQARNQRLDDLTKILSDKQMAQLIVFVPCFERDIKNLMNDVRVRRRLRDASCQDGNTGTQPGNRPMRRQRGNIPPDQVNEPLSQ